MKAAIATCFLTLLACQQTAPPTETRMAANQSSNDARYVIGVDGSSLQILRGGTSVTCLVSTEIEQARPSFDQSALIVSSDSYIPIKALSHCDGSPISPERIPPESGMLVDVSIRHNLYVALELVSTQPMAFLATVSDLDSSINLVTLPGAYIEGSPLEKQQQQAFVYQDDDGLFAKISRDGHYASVDGSLDCSENAYPGVWDIRKNAQVVLLDDESGAKCRKLFSNP